MLGAIIGDIAGSRFEFNNMFDYGFELFSDKCSFTDDTICTVAVADAILNGKSYQSSMLKWCRKYPFPMGGYGSMFAGWICSPHPQPYGSFGNGAAMRVSPVGWLFNTEKEVLAQAAATAEITHNHPEGVRGAVAVAYGIFLLRTGVDFETVIEKSVAAQYGEGWQDRLPAKGKFDGSCQGCVPLAFHILSESTDFEDAVRRAVSYGGDCDTVGAIVGSLAEARWPIPEWMRPRALSYLPSDMQTILEKFDFYKICLASNEK